MNKKIILPISLMLLVGFVVFVSAVQMDKDIPGYGTIGANYVQNEVSVTNGWNLIKGLGNPDWIVGGDISPNQIKAIYALNPLTKEYVKFHPENSELKNLDVAVDYLLGNTAFWVYVNTDEKNAKLSYYTLESAPLDKRQLFSGWNFLAFTSEMNGKTLSDIKGTCNFDKVYTWDNSNQRWGADVAPKPDSNNLGVINQEFVGYGFIVKVSSDCKLGTSSSGGNVPSVPNLP